MDTADYITVSEAADLLGRHRARVDQMIREGKLRVAAKVGHMRLLSRAEVERINPPGRGWRKNIHKNDDKT